MKRRSLVAFLDTLSETEKRELLQPTFDWYHKVLSELTTSASTKMEGLVVCDVKKMIKRQKDDIYLNHPP